MIPAFILLLYWFKNLAGIDIFESYSLSRQFPFNQLQRDITVSPVAGEVIIEESFDADNILQQEWSSLWMREEDRVIQEYDSNGLYHSQCLFIKSSSEKDWAYSSLKMVEVQEGDRFIYEGSGKIEGKEINASFGITLYDPEKNVIEWTSEIASIRMTPGFQKIEKEFTISNGIGFIRFVISGKGKGEFRFDEVKFRKI